MPVIYNSDNKTLTLHTNKTTYQMKVDEFNNLLHLYYGTRSEGCMDYMLTYSDRGFSGNPYESQRRDYSLDAQPQEFPVQGTSDFRSPVLIVRDENGTCGCQLKYKSHTITKGKYGLKGLPAVYSENDHDNAETLEIVMEDDHLQLEVKLLYGVLPNLDIITRAAIIKNNSQRKIYIEKAQTACLDMVTGNFDLIMFYGRHMMERNVERRNVKHGGIVINSRRGSSSHQYNPMLILADHHASEIAGRCWSMQFVYSGGFKAEVEKSQFGHFRMQMGLMEEQFSYPLSYQEELVLPEVIMSYSHQGFERLTHNLHKCLRRHVCRGRYRDVERPILINSWEAAYFDFDGNMIYQMAKDAKELGIEMIVLDDGWFGNRYDDNRALGDWVVNETKLKCSLGELIQSINDLDMKFGLWVEPEMISEDSDLYRAHPDWAMVIPGVKPVLARNQLVLDFSRKEVRDYIFDSLCKVLDQGNIEYLKWDCNRNIADVYSHTSSYQGKVLYDYMIGLYDFLERLMQKYPNMLIEGCSGGGGRFDAGMLYYTPQIWCSDNTDALDRILIQYGTSFGYPVSTMGSHVSICPNHQTNRFVSLETRSVVAMCGTFGYELNPKDMSEEDKDQLREQVRQFKNDGYLIHNGLFYRLSDPGVDKYAAWQFVSEDQKEAIVFVVMLENHANMPVEYVKPRGLKEDVFYQINETKKVYPASALMDNGFPIPQVAEEYKSHTFHFSLV